MSDTAYSPYDDEKETAFFNKQLKDNQNPMKKNESKIKDLNHESLCIQHYVLHKNEKIEVENIKKCQLEKKSLLPMEGFLGSKIRDRFFPQIASPYKKRFKWSYTV